MSKIVIFPGCSITVDGVYREDADLSSFSGLEDVHSLQIDEEARKGTAYLTQVAGVCKPPVDITDLTPYQDLINYVKNLCDAAENPCIFYATRDGAMVGEDQYYKTEPLYCCKFPRRTSAPTGFTSVAPEGELNAWQEWFWSGEAWVASPFPLTYVLSEGQTHMKKLLKTHYNELMNNQLREYNMWELSQDPNLENFTPADAEVHGHQTMLSYDNHLRAQVDSLTQTIDSATDVSQLYNIDLTLQP